MARTISLLLLLAATFIAGRFTAPGPQERSVSVPADVEEEPLREPPTVPLLGSPWLVDDTGAAGAGGAPASLQVRGARPSRPPQHVSDFWAQPAEPPTAPADPWDPESPEEEPAAPTRTPNPRRLTQVFVGAAAPLRLQRREIDLAATSELPLYVYELAGLAPQDTLHDFEFSALQGHPLPDEHKEGRSVELISPDAWWRALTHAIVERVGAWNWNKERHLLAWDPYRAQLFVRQEAVALQQVETVLDTFDERSRACLPVRAEFVRRGGKPVVLTCDVPRWKSVGACRGGATCYFCDYDVELHMGSSSWDPVLQRLEMGVGLRALRMVGEDTVLVALACADGEPRLAQKSVALAGLHTCDVPYEVALTEPVRWQGRLPAEPGVHTIALSKHVACRITVGPAPVAEEQPARVWRRRCVAPEETGNQGLPGAVYDVHLRRPGSVLSGTEGMPLFGAPGHGASLLRRPTFRVTGPEELRAGLIVDGDSAVCGGVVLIADSAGDPMQPYALDILLEAGHVRHDRPSREVPFLNRDGSRATGRARIPEADIDVTSRRVHLTPEGVGAIALELDLGSGPERCTLEVRRRQD